MSQQKPRKPKNEKTLRQLAFAIDNSQKEFRLIIVRYSYLNQLQYWSAQLQKYCQDELGLHAPILELQPNDETLHNSIEEYLHHESKSIDALQITGCHQVKKLDHLFKTTNQIRDTLRSELKLPLLIWLDDEMLTSFMEIAHDLYSWATSKRFIADINTIHSFLEMQSNEFFKRILQTDDRHLLGVIPLFDDRQRRQISIAIEELKNNNQTANLNLQATFDFADGRNHYKKREWEKALNYYEKSLKLWQRNIHSNYINEKQTGKQTPEDKNDTSPIRDSSEKIETKDIHKRIATLSTTGRFGMTRRVCCTWTGTMRSTKTSA